MPANKPKTEPKSKSTCGTLDAAFAALADPTRRAIITHLAGGEATVLELAQPFDISLPAISRHLKVLERAGLITRARQAQRRPCQLRVDALAEVSNWAEHTRRAWESRFDRLTSYLDELQRQTTSKTPAAVPATSKSRRQPAKNPKKKPSVGKAT